MSNNGDIDYYLNKQGKRESEYFDESGYVCTLFMYLGESEEQAIRRELMEAGIVLESHITYDNAFDVYLENYDAILKNNDCNDDTDDIMKTKLD